MSTDAELFADALERPPGERAAFLAKLCPDSEQRARIEALLQSHEVAEVVLAAPLNHRPVEPLAEAGTMIGRYKLLEKIGEGGCGVVWMAQQTEPVRRLVALKIVKLGMDTKEVIARFEAERQALALLDHPHITKIFDAGATATGRPFFAMDLVRGLPITRYCDEKQLSIHDRLQLFIHVCRALHHAHEKGLVHRDIKPSNIIVTHDGDVPVPKLIDFGIAKATEGRLTDHTFFTAFEQFMGTPAYMSPEQADYNANEIDRRSDVYSLGALLYELVSGRPPFDPKTLTSRGLQQVRRTILEVQPVKPSSHFQDLPRAEQTALAGRRGFEVAQYALHLRGDLDWIAMKALEKNRDRRYPTAAALGDDVGRYLEHEPVQARPPSLGYRAGKLLQRHGVAAWAAFTAAVVTGVVGGAAIWQVQRVHRVDQERPKVGKSVQSPVLAPAVRTKDFADTALLVAQLRENFFGEPLPLVREDEIAQAVDRWLATFENVPRAQRTAQMERDRVMMLARQALSSRLRGGTEAGGEQADGAIAAAEELVAKDPSAEAKLMLACALAVPAQGDSLPADATAATRMSFQRSLELLRSLYSDQPTTRIQVQYLEVVTSGGAYLRSLAGVVAAIEEARRILGASHDTAKRTDLQIIQGKILCLEALQRNFRDTTESEPEVEALALADSVAREQPNSIDVWRLRRNAYFKSHPTLWPPTECIPLLLAAEKAAHEVVRLDPSNNNDWFHLVRIRGRLVQALRDTGRINEAAALARRTLEEGGLVLEGTAEPSPTRKSYLGNLSFFLAELEADRGHALVARRALQLYQNYGPFLRAAAGLSAAGEQLRRPVAIAAKERKVRLLLGEQSAVVHHGEALLEELYSLLRSPAATNTDFTIFMPEVFQLQVDLAQSYANLGDWSAAEKAMVVQLCPSSSAKGDRWYEGLVR